jgi:hypothetical protein
MEGMAFTQANERIPNAFSYPIFSDGLMTVLGTCWIEPATGWEKRGKCNLIDPNENK